MQVAINGVRRPTQRLIAMHNSKGEPDPPVPPSQTPPAPVKEPPDSPTHEPDSPVREPDPAPPKRY